MTIRRFMQIVESAVVAHRFNEWFGNSKVVDGVGRPLRVYHGTRAGFDRFQRGQQASNPYLWNDNGLGFFFTADPGRRSDSGPWTGAAGYAGVRQRDGEPQAPSGANIMPVFLAIRNPYVVGYTDYISEVEEAGGGEAYRERLETLGYDGVFRQAVTGKGVDTYVAFHPDQIRSAVGIVADEPVRDVDLWEGVQAYHGTRRNFRAFWFRPLSYHPSSMGVWFTSSRDVAAEFARTKEWGEAPPRVVEVELSIDNPAVFETYDDFERACAAAGRADEMDYNAKRLRRQLVRRGHDGVKIEKSDSDGMGVRTDWIAFRRDQIKILRTVENDSVRTKSVTEGHKLRRYPMAPPGEWYGDGDYASRGGRIVMMSPDEYLARVRPLDSHSSRENIDELKAHMLAGRTLDPLVIYADGKEDGRHRAYAAKELGIASVPVIVFGE